MGLEGQGWDWDLLERLLPGVDPSVDDQIAAGAERACTELADVIALVWEQKKSDRADQPGKTVRDMLWKQEAWEWR